jgi:hypothetical protein
VTERKKWKDIVRQAKAHSGLQCQWKKKDGKTSIGLIWLRKGIGGGFFVNTVMNLRVP